MDEKLTILLQKDEEWSIAYCPQVPGANGQGKTSEEAKESLHQAIQLLSENQRENGSTFKNRQSKFGNFK